MIASTKVMMLQPCWNITNQSDGERRSSEKHFEYLLWHSTHMATFSYCSLRPSVRILMCYLELSRQSSYLSYLELFLIFKVININTVIQSV